MQEEAFQKCSRARKCPFDKILRVQSALLTKKPPLPFPNPSWSTVLHVVSSLLDPLFSIYCNALLECLNFAICVLNVKIQIGLFLV